MNAMWLLANFAYINPAEAAVIMGVNTTTVRRHFQELLKDGLATCQMLGRAGHLEQHWVLTREGLERQFGFLDDVPRWLKEPGTPQPLRHDGPAPGPVPHSARALRRTWAGLAQGTRHPPAHRMQFHPGKKPERGEAGTGVDPSGAFLHP